MNTFYYVEDNEIKELKTVRTAENLKELQPKYRQIGLHTDKESIPAPEGYKRDGDSFVKTPEKIAEEARQEAKTRLAEIDRETVRPLRAKMAGTATTGDEQKLADLEAEAQTLRDKI